MRAHWNTCSLNTICNKTAFEVWKGFKDCGKGIVNGELKRLLKKEKQGYPGAGREKEPFE